MVDLPPELWARIAENFTAEELRKYCGVSHALFEFAMDKLYDHYCIPAPLAFIGKFDDKTKKYAVYRYPKPFFMLDCLRGPVVRPRVRKLGLNIHSIEELLKAELRDPHLDRKMPDLWGVSTTASPAQAEAKGRIQKFRHMLTLKRNVSELDTTEEILFNTINGLERLEALHICWHLGDEGSTHVNLSIAPMARILNSLAPRLRVLSFHVTPDILQALNSSIPDLQLDELEVTLTDNLRVVQTSADHVSETFLLLISRNSQTLTSLMVYFWDDGLDFSPFFTGIGELQIPHLSRLWISNQRRSFLLDPRGLNKFIVRHSRTLKDLLLSEETDFPVSTLHAGSLDWYRLCFENFIPYSLTDLTLGIPHNLQPFAFSFLKPLTSSMITFTLISAPLSVNHLDHLLSELECSQLKSLAIKAEELDCRFINVLTLRCPKLERLSFQLPLTKPGLPQKTLPKFNEELNRWNGRTNDEWECEKVFYYKCAILGYQWARGDQISRLGFLTLAEQAFFVRAGWDTCNRSPLASSG